MNDKPISDIIGLVVVLSALLFSDEVAAAVGPYVVIIVASTIGASFALARREKSARAKAVWFFFRQVGLALLLTVSAAAILQAQRPELLPRVTVAPIALVIGFMDWPWALTKIARMAIGGLDLLRGKGGTQ